MRIHWHAKPSKAELLFITYPGFGMAGLIAADYLISQYHLPTKGVLMSEASEHAYLIIHEGSERYPLSISQHGRALLITALTSLHGHEHAFLSAVTHLHQQYHFKRIIILDAFARHAETQRLYHHPDTIDETLSMPLQEGVIIGIYPLLRMIRLPVRAYFAEASPNSADIHAARLLLTAYAYETQASVDLKKLDEMEESYRQRMREVIQRQKHAQRERQHQHTFYIG